MRQIASHRGEHIFAHPPSLASIQLQNGDWLGVGEWWGGAGGGGPGEGGAPFSLPLGCPLAGSTTAEREAGMCVVGQNQA